MSFTLTHIVIGIHQDRFKIYRYDVPPPALAVITHLSGIRDM